MPQIASLPLEDAPIRQQRRHESVSSYGRPMHIVYFLTILVDPSVVCKKNLDADLLVLVFVAAELYYFSPFLQAEIDLVLLIYSPKELVKPNM
jgi:hypothetical protein